MSTSLTGTIKGKVVFASLNKSRPTMNSKTDPEHAGATEFSITIELDEAEAKRLQSIRKELKVKSELKTENKNGEEITPQFSFRRAHTTKNGAMLSHPVVVNKQLQPINDSIGAGSEVIVQYKARPWTAPNSTQIRHTLGLEAVKVLKLVPYEPKVELLFTADPEEDDAVDAALKEGNDSVF